MSYALGVTIRKIRRAHVLERMRHENYADFAFDCGCWQSEVGSAVDRMKQDWEYGLQTCPIHGAGWSIGFPSRSWEERMAVPHDQDEWGEELRRWPDAERRGLTLGLRLPPFEVWRSREFLVQFFREGQWVRMTVNRTEKNGEDWAEGISWDELQRLKREAGRGDQWAAELYPADDSVINDHNMRHLWILADPPPFAWRLPEE